MMVKEPNFKRKYDNDDLMKRMSNEKKLQSWILK